jgi:hypothetical protein
VLYLTLSADWSGNGTEALAVHTRLFLEMTCGKPKTRRWLFSSVRSSLWGTGTEDLENGVAIRERREAGTQTYQESLIAQHSSWVTTAGSWPHDQVDRVYTDCYCHCWFSEWTSLSIRSVSKTVELSFRSFLNVPCCLLNKCH